MIKCSTLWLPSLRVKELTAHVRVGRHTSSHGRSRCIVRHILLAIVVVLGPILAVLLLHRVLILLIWLVLVMLVQVLLLVVVGSLSLILEVFAWIVRLFLEIALVPTLFNILLLALEALV